MSQLPPPSYDHEKLNIENVISEKPPSYSVTNNSIHGQQSHLAPQYPSQSNAVFVPAQIVPATSGNTSRTVNMVTTYQTIPACTVIPEVSNYFFIKLFIYYNLTQLCVRDFLTLR